MANGEVITLECTSCACETEQRREYLESPPTGCNCHHCGKWIAYANPIASSVIGEAVLADAVRVEVPRTFEPLLTAPDPNAPLWNLLEQWQRGGFTLPIDSAQRKLVPLQSGNYDYFAAAHAAIAAWSYINNQKHNPGMPLHWSQGKSNDHRDCIARHTLDVGDAGDDPAMGLLELTARAWRALAELQMFAQAQGAPVPPGARTPAVEASK